MGIFLRVLSKLVVELGLEPAVLPTFHLTAGERLRLGCPEELGRLVNGFTEAGVGQRSPWKGTRVQGLTPLTKPSPGPACWFRAPAF